MDAFGDVTAASQTAMMKTAMAVEPAATPELAAMLERVELAKRAERLRETRIVWAASDRIPQDERVAVSSRAFLRRAAGQWAVLQPPPARR